MYYEQLIFILFLGAIVDQKNLGFTMAEELLEQGFNENELADIMDEIEDLEKEFLGDQEADAGAPTVTKPKEKVAKAPTPPLKIVENPPPEDELNVKEVKEQVENPILGLENSDDEKIVETDDDSLSQEIASEGVAQGLFSEKSPTERDKLYSVRKEKTPNQLAVDSVILEENEDNEVKEISTPKTVSQTTPQTQTVPTPQIKFDLTGEISLNLSLIFGGQTINLNLDKNEGLIIELDSGARFVFPNKR